MLLPSLPSYKALRRGRYVLRNEKPAALTRTLKARGSGSRCPATPIIFRWHRKLISADVKALTIDKPALLESAKPAFQKYNEEQLTNVKLPGNGKNVCKRLSLYSLSKIRMLMRFYALGSDQLV